MNITLEHVIKGNKVEEATSSGFDKLLTALTTACEIIEDNEPRYIALLGDTKASKTLRKYIDALKQNAHEEFEEIELKCTFLPYDRYPSGRIPYKTITVKGATEVDALAQLAYELDIYLSPEEIYDDNMAVNDILQEIEERNGDGCDYISFLKNVTTGDIYINEGEY
jgi:hypothetical protein